MDTYVTRTRTRTRSQSNVAVRVPQLRIDQRIFKTPSNRKLDVNVVQSNYHIELTPRCVQITLSRGTLRWVYIAQARTANDLQRRRELGQVRHPGHPEGDCTDAAD
jgi:hypothetical protein